MAQIDFQAWLDRVSQSFFDDDFATYRASVQLPMMLVTQGGNMVVSEEEALRKGFDSWRDMLRVQGVTDMVRIAHEVTVLNDGMIDGRYTTHLLRNAMPIVPPFESSMMLVFVEGAWKAASVASGMSNTKWPIEVPRVDPETTKRKGG